MEYKEILDKYAVRRFSIEEIKLLMFDIVLGMAEEEDSDDVVLSTLQDYIILLDSLKLSKEGRNNANESS